MLHLLGEVAGDRARDEVVDLGGSREIVERAPEGALREVLLDAQLLGSLGDGDVEDLLRSEAARDGGEEKIRTSCSGVESCESTCQRRTSRTSRGKSMV